jgi:hypothetical protein
MGIVSGGVGERVETGGFENKTADSLSDRKSN